MSRWIVLGTLSFLVLSATLAFAADIEPAHYASCGQYLVGGTETNPKVYLLKDTMECSTYYGLIAREDNTVIDCQNHFLHYKGPKVGIGIDIGALPSDDPARHIWVRNCKASNWAIGIRGQNLTESAILNSAAYQNTNGFQVNNANMVLLHNVIATDNDKSGINVSSSTTVVISEARVQRNLTGVMFFRG